MNQREIEAQQERTRRREAQERLRQMRSGDGVITLTKEVALLVVTAGGPTFGTISSGHYCNQTGARVSRNGAKDYAKRVTDMAWPHQKKTPGPIKLESSQGAGDGSRKKNHDVKLEIWPTVAGSIYCPACKSYYGHASGMKPSAELYCGSCGRTFIVR